jgi:hypothetical protein
MSYVSALRYLERIAQIRVFAKPIITVFVNHDSPFDKGHISNIRIFP